MEKIICRIFGHNFRYNFASLPSKCICKRCYKKWKADYSILPAKWIEADSFDSKYGTDKERAERWIP